MDGKLEKVENRTEQERLLERKKREIGRYNIENYLYINYLFFLTNFI